MRIRIQKRGLVPAAVVAVVGTVALYLGSTEGLAAWHASRSTPRAGVGYLPTVIENAPPTVPTTDVYGPPGSVSVVYAGTEVERGLTGTLDQPWIAISARTGDYRALVVPGLPAPGQGGVSVSPDGSQLAWAGDEGLVVYDAVTGETARPDVAGADAVGAFSADGERLAVHGDGLEVVDLDSGRVVAEAAAEADEVTLAAWRPDGSAIDFVSGRELVTVGADGEVSSQATTIPQDATLAWSPRGDQLADLHDESGINRLYLSPLRKDGTVSRGEQVDTSGLSLQHLLGFSGERTVAVDALVLESGNVERVLDVSLDGRTRTDLMSLPPPGENWVDTSTVAVATDTLFTGSYPWPNPLWPWSYGARMGACALLMFFLFGLYVTRRPRT